MAHDERLSARSADGVELSATVTGPARQGTPLLLVHGTSGDAARWAPVLPGLAAERPVYALDRRGRGGSGDGADAYEIALEFEDVRAICAAIAARHEGTVDLLGHSYGGVCSVEATILGIPALRRFILYEPPVPPMASGPRPPFIDPATIDKMSAYLREERREMVLETFVLEVVRAPLAEFEMMRADPSWANRVAAAHTIPRELAALNDYRADSRQIAAIDAPTRLLLGTESADFLATATATLSDLIPGATLVMLSGHAHNAMNTGPELFIREVTGFLDS